MKRVVSLLLLGLIVLSTGMIVGCGPTDSGAGAGDATTTEQEGEGEGQSNRRYE